MDSYKMDEIAIVDGCRTPFMKAGTVYRNINSLELGSLVVRELIERNELDYELIDELIFSEVIISPKMPNVAREIVLNLDLPRKIYGYTISMACISSMKTTAIGISKIMTGQSKVVIAGGVEVLSDFPVLISKGLKEAFIKFQKAKKIPDQIKPFFQISLKDLLPDFPQIAEPSTGLSMGEHTEIMIRKNEISREEQDKFALESHRKAAMATKQGKFEDEIISVSLPPNFSKFYKEDNGIRYDTSMEKLRKLKPVFDRKYGTITAGNATPLTDGASALLLMPVELAKSLGLNILGVLISYDFKGLDPDDQMLLGPVYSIPGALEKAGMQLKDIELFEMHEAFAGQVLSNLKLMNSKRFCKEVLNLSRPIGEIPMDRLNVNGGSIAVGHPFAATGARLIMNLLREMKRRNYEIGMATACAAGGMGCTMIFKNVS